MKIIIDTREQRPFDFKRYKIEVIRDTLSVGDYSIVGFEDRVSIERKELGDLINCLMGSNRARFERELQKLRFFEMKAVVVESSLEDIAQGQYRSEMKPHAALQSISAFMVRYQVPFLFCGGREGAEYMTHSLLAKYAAEIEKRYRKLIKEVS